MTIETSPSASKRRLSETHIEANALTLGLVCAEMQSEAPTDVTAFVAAHMPRSASLHGFRRGPGVCLEETDGHSGLGVTTRQIAETIRLLATRRADGTPMHRPFDQDILDLCAAHAIQVVAPAPQTSDDD